MKPCHIHLPGAGRKTGNVFVEKNENNLEKKKKRNITVKVSKKLEHCLMCTEDEMNSRLPSFISTLSLSQGPKKLAQIPVDYIFPPTNLIVVHFGESRPQTPPYLFTPKL